MQIERKRIKDTLGDRIFVAVNYSMLILILVIVLYPLIYIVSCSFSDPNAVSSGQVWFLPVRPTLMGYQGVFENSQVMTGYANSLFYMILGTSINIVVTFMAAYPLSRKDVILGKGIIMFLFTFTMLFSGGMIPTFMVVNKLKMVNTIWAMVIPNAMAVWNLIITKTFLQSNIPDELYEAAELDGSNDIQTLFRIVLPLSGTIIAVNALFYAVGHWNAFFNAVLYLRKSNLYPLQLVLRNILIMNQISSAMLSNVSDLARRDAMTTLLKYSLIVVSALPLMIAYPFVQKFFVKGVLVGSIKS